MFDEKIIQKLGFYVYMLIDPGTDKPFYVGKGVNNRVFEHLRCALTDGDIDSLKYELIREIESRGEAVKHIIVRHDLSEAEALNIEASIIDVLTYCGFDLTNLVSGQDSEKGIMNTDEIIRLYKAEPLYSMGEDCILININKKYDRGSGANAIYEATKGIWAIGKKNVLGKNGEILRKYVLSEYRGLIVEVFEVHKWNEEERGYTPKARKYGETRIGLSFTGKVAAPAIRDLFINKSIAHKKKKGSATAHRLTL